MDSFPYYTAEPGTGKTDPSWRGEPLSFVALFTGKTVDPNVFETANAGFAQAMYEEFLKDPATVGPEWRRLFESGVVGEGNGAGRDGGAASETSGKPKPAAPAPSGVSPIKGPAAKLVANMTESLTVPTATTFRELSVAVLEGRPTALNAPLHSAGKSQKISFTPLIAYALVQATKRMPVMGHSLTMVDGVPHRV